MCILKFNAIHRVIGKCLSYNYLCTTAIKFVLTLFAVQLLMFNNQNGLHLCVPFNAYTLILKCLVLSYQLFSIALCISLADIDVNFSINTSLVVATSSLQTLISTSSLAPWPRLLLNHGGFW